MIEIILITLAIGYLIGFAIARDFPESEANFLLWFLITADLFFILIFTANINY
jgi:hypothetical protein